MKLRSWLWLIGRDVLSQKPRLVILIFCISLSATIFGLAMSAILYLRTEIRPRLRELFPERRVIVQPASGELLFFKFEGQKIPGSFVDELRAREDVETVFPQMPAYFPVSASFNMESVGMGFTTDVILFGIDSGMVQKDVSKPFTFDAPKTNSDFIPVIVSDYFLDAYNLGFAESAGMPKLSRTAFLGVEFEMMLGESTLGLGESRAAPVTRKARVVGMTSDPLLFGITIPLETMRDFNKRFVPKNENVYTVLHVDLRSPEDTEAVQAFVEGKKYNFRAQKEVLDRFLKVVGTVEGILAGGFLIVLALATVGVFSTAATAMRERRPAWGLHRATGLGPGGVLMLACGHGLAAAIPSMAIAAGLTWGISQGLAGLIAEYSDLSFLAGNPFDVSIYTYISIASFSLAFSLVPMILFTLPICRKRPVALLAERSL